MSTCRFREAFEEKGREGGLQRVQMWVLEVVVGEGVGGEGCSFGAMRR
jgi:hypothetical protein